MKRLWKSIVFFAIANMLALTTAQANAQADERIQEIAQHCSAKWGTDYDMQVYCRRKHTDALDRLAELSKPWFAESAQYSTELKLLDACDRKWRSEFDMTLYCVNKQLGALKELRRQDR
jgi:hypothetical protein